MSKKPNSRADEAGVSLFRLIQNPSGATNVWILVADKARARLFEPIEGGKKLNEVACFDNPDAKLHATARDRLPRTNESVGSSRHAIEPHTTLEEKSIDRFAHALGKEMESRRIQRQYDRLVLVAPPRFLGALHRLFDKPLRDCVAAEVSADLTTWPVERILEHLSPKPAA